MSVWRGQHSGWNGVVDRVRSKDSLERIRRDIIAAYSGTEAHRLVVRLHRHNRWITYPEYEKSVGFCYHRMREIGLDDVQLLRFPIDGRRCYGNWKTPKYWDIRRAYLQVRLGRQWITLADYQKVPTSIFPYSAPTRGEIHTRLVSWDAAEVQGKLVFRGDTMPHLLDVQRRGALGLVTDFSPNWPKVRSDADFREAHRWENAFLFEDDTGLVGFSLSRNQGVRMRRELDARGVLECRFRVDGRIGRGHLMCVTGCLRGVRTPHEEVVAVAHLYEVGANDNASGVAGTIEALRILRSLIRRGRLEPPPRTIRAIFTMEIVGFLAYFLRAAPKNVRYVAGINPDMIGEDQRRCRSVLHLYPTPDSMATFADPLLLELLRRSAPPSFRYQIKPFIINDNMISDPTIGIPCPALIHLRDRYYHSNEDTPDKVSPKTLQIVGGAMAAYLYIAASLDKPLADELANCCLRYTTEQFEQAAGVGQLTHRQVRHLLDCGMRRLESIEPLTGSSLNGAKRRLLRLARQFRAVPGPKEAVPASVAREAARFIPVRTVIGPLTFQHLPVEQRLAQKFQPMWNPQLNLPLFWADGRRTIREIHKRSSQEMDNPLSLSELLEYFRTLERERLVRLQPAVGVRPTAVRRPDRP